MPQCKKCGVELEFGVNAPVPKKREPIHCRPCQAARSKAWRDQNRERARELSRNGHRRFRQRRRDRNRLTEQLDHQHMLITALIDAPPQTAEQGARWLTELVDLIDMKVLIPAQAVHCKTVGNEGVTGIICLETSHASFHAWSDVEHPFIQVDVYSCKPFAAQTVLDHLQEFQPTAITYKVIDRNRKPE